MIETSRAYQYAQWCVAETDGMVPKYVKKQAESWIRIADGEDSDAYVCEKSYKRIARLMKIMVHPDLHCPMTDGLEDYAWFLITAVLCTKMHETGARYYTTAVLEIARKNFKTFVSAVIFILLMLTEPAFSRFFSVAPDLALSSELKNAVRKIIKSSPALIDEVDPAFKLLRSQIRCLLNDNEYTPLAYSRDGMDGRMATAFLADEAGALDSYPVEAMRSSQITLRNKLGIVISTQYPNDNNVMTDEIDMSKKVLDGLLEDRRRFALLYEPDDELRQGELWKTEDRVIYQSNPVAIAHTYIADELRKRRAIAALYPNKRENFLCKHCNILYKSLGVEGFLDIQRVKLCRREKSDEWWRGRRVWLGVDLSQTEDNTAIAMVAEENGILYARVIGFVPAGRVEYKTQKEQVDYNRLIAAGECIACGDEVIDYSVVEDYVLTLEERLGVEIVQIGYDRYNAISSVQKWEAAGYECVEIRQHSSVLHMPTKLLKESVLGKTFFYDESRMLEINFQNARCTEDTNLNKYVNKKKSAGKVDMVVSLIDALYLLQQDMLYGSSGFVVQVG
ncbi:MAG: terminase large subunit [Eubacteriales bacterium]|nr:terminase large subunit [Eubacteriales bacterium]